MKRLNIKTSYITLGQLLKWQNFASSGGEVKAILNEEKIMVNGALENRRGKKLYPGDTVEFREEVWVIKTDD
jgi:S4 domain protein YaaA